MNNLTQVRSNPKAAFAQGPRQPNDSQVAKPVYLGIYSGSLQTSGSLPFVDSTQFHPNPHMSHSSPEIPQSVEAEVSNLSPMNVGSVNGYPTKSENAISNDLIQPSESPAEAPMHATVAKASLLSQDALCIQNVPLTTNFQCPPREGAPTNSFSPRTPLGPLHAGRQEQALDTSHNACDILPSDEILLQSPDPFTLLERMIGEQGSMPADRGIPTPMRYVSENAQQSAQIALACNAEGGNINFRGTCGLQPLNQQSLYGGNAAILSGVATIESFPATCPDEILPVSLNATAVATSSSQPHLQQCMQSSTSPSTQKQAPSRNKKKGKHSPARGTRNKRANQSKAPSKGLSSKKSSSSSPGGGASGSQKKAKSGGTNLGVSRRAKASTKPTRSKQAGRASASAAPQTVAQQTQAPTTKRKPRTYSQAVPSQHCHICSRKPNPESPHAYCGNLSKGTCRKTVCKKCFLEHGWSMEKALLADITGWVCSHCAGKCPPRAQCHIYDRTSERRRNKTVNHRKPKQQSSKNANKSGAKPRTQLRGEQAQDTNTGVDLTPTQPGEIPQTGALPSDQGPHVSPPAMPHAVDHSGREAGVVNVGNCTSDPTSVNPSFAMSLEGTATPHVPGSSTYESCGRVQQEPIYNPHDYSSLESMANCNVSVSPQPVAVAGATGAECLPSGSPVTPKSAGRLTLLGNGSQNIPHLSAANGVLCKPNPFLGEEDTLPGQSIGFTTPDAAPAAQLPQQHFDPLQGSYLDGLDMLSPDYNNTPVLYSVENTLPGDPFASP